MRNSIFKSRQLMMLIFLFTIVIMSLNNPVSLQANTEYSLEGIKLGAKIIKDQWGVSHIYGRTIEDLFFAQGFNAARDRLWQLDLWRRQGEGKLSEAFGDRFLEKDKAARLFLYRGNLKKELKSYHPYGHKIISSFVSGINAYIDLVKKNSGLLPLEFKITGTMPGYWSITSPLIRIFGLTRNLTREVALAKLVYLMGTEAVEKLHVFEPPTELIVPEELDLSLFMNPDILSKYNLARSGISFLPDDIVSKDLSEFEKIKYAKSLSTARQENSQVPLGSNNWTISGDLTETGRPILANDPHRAHTVPSLRYIAHLVGPGWNVIGAGEPALPGISIGHNNHIAFGLTIFSFADEEDLYVYDTNPENPLQYRYLDRWEDMKLVKESFSVRGNREKVHTELKFTRHGPVLYEDYENHKAYALRAAYLEYEGTAAYLASLRVNQAKNFKQFVKAMEKHYCPSENMAYADIQGNIGWFGGSIAPIRSNWNGLLPVPGNGAYEWSGFLNPKKLPRIKNPKEGFFASANQYNIPDGYKYTNISNREWLDSFRFDRIIEFLYSGSSFRIEDSMNLQLDEKSLPAIDLISLLYGLDDDSEDIKQALTLLRDWDGVVSKDSISATIYEFWVTQLHKNVFALYVPSQASPFFGFGDRRILIDLLYSPDEAFGTDPVEGRDELLIQSLGEALLNIKDQLGEDMAFWQWGNYLKMYYIHSLSAAVDPETREILNIDPLPRGGDSTTVNLSYFPITDIPIVFAAPSYRQIIDVGDWDNSFAVNSPGQSGDPESPHYDDLFQMWADGEYFPLYFSPEKILEVKEEIIMLKRKFNKSYH